MNGSPQPGADRRRRRTRSARSLPIEGVAEDEDVGEGLHERVRGSRGGGSPAHPEAARAKPRPHRAEVLERVEVPRRRRCPAAGRRPGSRRSARPARMRNARPSVKRKWTRPSRSRRAKARIRVARGSSESRVRSWGATISTQSMRSVSGRPPVPKRVSPEPEADDQPPTAGPGAAARARPRAACGSRRTGAGSARSRPRRRRSCTLAARPLVLQHRKAGAVLGEDDAVGEWCRGAAPRAREPSGAARSATREGRSDARAGRAAAAGPPASGRADERAGRTAGRAPPAGAGCRRSPRTCRSTRPVRTAPRVEPTMLAACSHPTRRPRRSRSAWTARCTKGKLMPMSRVGRADQEQRGRGR